MTSALKGKLQEGVCLIIVGTEGVGLGDPGADGVVDGFERLGPAANPARHTRSTSRRGVKQILKDLCDPLFRHELLGVEINRSRSDALAMPLQPATPAEPISTSLGTFP